LTCQFRGCAIILCRRLPPLVLHLSDLRRHEQSVNSVDAVVLKTHEEPHLSLLRHRMKRRRRALNRRRARTRRAHPNPRLLLLSLFARRERADYYANLSVNLHLLFSILNSLATA